MKRVNWNRFRKGSEKSKFTLTWQIVVLVLTAILVFIGFFFPLRKRQCLNWVITGTPNTRSFPMIGCTKYEVWPEDLILEPKASDKNLRSVIPEDRIELPYAEKENPKR